MKLVTFLPFVNKSSFDLKWLPISMPNLVGNLKEFFPKIIFHQIDLSEEIKKIFSEDFCSDLSCQIANFTNIIPVDKDLPRFKKLFSAIDNYLCLEKYDHYFFSHYNPSELGIKANLFLAKYLKKKYKDKKIIFGGIYGVGKNYSKRSFEELDFIDSSVI